MFPAAAERDAIKARLQPITERWIQENPEGRKRYDAMTAVLEDIRKGR